VKISTIEDNGYENPYVIFTINGKDTKVTEYRIVGDSYAFDCMDIAPHMMGDTISAILYATHGEIEYSSKAKEYSVTAYCYAILDNYTSDSYAKLRTVIVDLLNYGTEAQRYMNYKVNNLVNAKLTEEQKEMGTSADRVLVNAFEKEYATVSNPLAAWKGAGLNLEQSIGMRFKFVTTCVEGLSVKVTGEAGDWTIDSSKFESIGDGNYYVYLEDMNAGQMSKIVYVTIYKDGKAVSNTLRYSIESYAAQAQNTSFGNLVKAMIRYGDSARVFAS
jgi:hypothetical protein